MSNIIPFQFGTKEVRVHMDEAGNPWWMLAECLQAIGLTNVTKAAGRIDAEDLKKSQVLDSRGVVQEIWLMNESGLYTLLLRSNKPEAKEFRRWVTSEVLPSIRKTGTYQVPQVSRIDKYPELRAIQELVLSVAEARDLAQSAQAEAQEAQAAARHAQENADRALQTQLFYTVAEYVYINKLDAQLPETGYKACSDHLRLYCLDHNIPFRKVSIGGKRWDQEYAYHQSVYVEVLPGWLRRRFAQEPLSNIRPLHKDDAS